MTRLIARGINAMLLALLVFASVLWVWSGHNTSMGFVLQHAPDAFGPAKALSASQVNASVRKGGTIGELRWTSEGLHIRAVDVKIDYDLNSLLERRLDQVVLSIGQLHIDDKNARAEPMTPPSELTLPLPLDLRLQVKEFFWQGGSSALMTDLSLAYVFDGLTHRIDQGQFKLAAGSYSIQGELEATSPMRLKADARAQLRAPIPGSSQTQTLIARASLNGEIYLPESTLGLKVELDRIDGAAERGSSGLTGAAQVRLAATLAPWKAQPLVQVQAAWSALDLAMLWPQAPSTALSGQAEVKPASPASEQAWSAHIELHNKKLGPFDQNGFPLSRLKTMLVYQNAAWFVQDLQAQIAGGTLQAKGRYLKKDWQIEAVASQVQPRQLDTRLSGGPVSAQLRARQGEVGLAFDLDLNIVDGTGIQWTTWPLTLQSLQTTGSWQSPTLSLNKLRARSSEARLDGSGSYRVDSHGMAGQFDLEIPGLSVKVAGTAGPEQGQGSLRLRAGKIERGIAWLKRLPPLKTTLAQVNTRGDLELDASWQGGWKDLGKELQFDLGLKAAELQWQQASTGGSGSTPIELQKVQLKATGRPQAFEIGSFGQASVGPQRLQWSTQASARQTGSKAWQAEVNTLKLGWHRSSDAPAWSLVLAAPGQAGYEPLTISWRGEAGQSLWQLTPGQARIGGPLPGAVDLRWDASSASVQNSGQTFWQTSGSVPRLPMAWIEALSPKTLSELGLSSDLMLQARWEAAQDQSLHLKALLERSSGDLRLNINDTRQPSVAAELRELRMQLDLNERQVAGSFRWDSARAGRALMAFSTTLGNPLGPWHWPDDSPVAAGIQLQSPPAKAWSAFAPPGWRLQGMVDADITLEGTRANPIWRGQLRGRELAVRSLVHGLDLDRGEFKANLDGQTLRIESASIKGAGGSGGNAKLSGSMTWLTDSKVPELTSHLRADLKAELEEMRVSLRPDRRISASGNLAAHFDGRELSLTGAVQADHALITLPDDDTPALSDDVFVRKTRGQEAASLIRPSTITTDLPFAFRLAVDLSPGADFQIRGRGLEARLSGKLKLQSRGPGSTQLTGTLSTVGGVYQALGQRLNIEKGAMLFSGIVDNPGLDILAIRPQIPHRIGVQIGGNVLAPRVRLYADPELPEAEKLSWLLLGRSSGGSGGEAALMQQATMAMISSRIKQPTTTLAQSFGLDELGIQGKSSVAGREIDTASLTLGKRLSKDLYVAYEHSLAGTVGAFSVFYDLSSRVTVRAQAGEKSAIDLIYTLRYD